MAGERMDLLVFADIEENPITLSKAIVGEGDGGSSRYV